MPTYTRRDLIKMGSGAVALSQARAFASAAVPSTDIDVRITAGNKRFSKETALRWVSATGSAANAVVLDPTVTYQEILGFGAVFTDAACYMLNQLDAGVRERLFHELFHPSEMGLNVCRTCIGSSDYSTVAYSFDEGDPDPELLRFSIEHDRAYILPMLRLARKTNPDLYYFAAPWSPPDWMKTNRSMLGGNVRKSCPGVYAKYVVKFLQAYAAEGVTVNSLSPQTKWIPIRMD
jgi:glucosylceramidase